MTAITIRSINEMNERKKRVVRKVWKRKQNCKQKKCLVGNFEHMKDYILPSPFSKLNNDVNDTENNNCGIMRGKKFPQRNRYKLK